MCSPAPPELNFTMLFLNPGNWAFVFFMPLLGTIAAYIFFRRTEPETLHRISLALWTCVGLLFTTAILASTVLVRNFDSAFDNWYHTASGENATVVCSQNGLDTAISSHYAVSNQLITTGSYLAGAAGVLIAVYLIMLYISLDSRGRRQAAS